MKSFSWFFPAPISAIQLVDAITKDVDQAATKLSWLALFTTEIDDDSLQSLLTQINSRFPDIPTIGCSAESLVHNGTEHEQEPGVAILGFAMPDVDVQAFHLEYQATTEGAAFVGWPDAPLTERPDPRCWIAIGEPFSFPMDLWLERMNEDYPQVPIAGGMSSAGSSPGENRIWLNDQIAKEGAIVLRLAGPLRVSTIVSQGCRPIGEPLVVTRVERNAIMELGGRPALEVLRDLWKSLPTSEQKLMQQGLHVGRVVDEAADSRTMGDFLIRSVSGIEPDLAAIVVGDFFRAGQTIQFHLRDEASASHELNHMLSKAAQSQKPQGGLLFTCNGRGTRMFPQPHHDGQAIQEHFPNLPLAGFFATGEIGPIAGSNFFHGFTASAVLFAPTDAETSSSTQA